MHSFIHLKISPNNMDRSTEHVFFPNLKLLLLYETCATIFKAITVTVLEIKCTYTI
jgi:hypothetical protein